jgi:hypothetical protein
MIARPGAAVCIAVLLASVAGCVSTGSPAAVPSAAPSSVPAPSVSPADSRTPLEMLVAGIPTDKSVAYHYSMTGTDGPTSGVIDPATKTAEYDVVAYFYDPDYTMTLKVLMIGKKSWARVVLAAKGVSGLSYIPRRWMVLDPKKIPTPGELPFEYQKVSDPAFAGDIFGGANEVRQTSPGHFAGTTDLSDSGSDLVGAARITALGHTATKLRFTAALDAGGRLTTASVVMPASKKFRAFTYKIVYDKYATTPVPKAPTGTTKAIPEVYKWIGY